MGLGNYLRFIGRFLADQPRFWKSVATDISKWLRKPYAEVAGGMYVILWGILAIASTFLWNRDRDYVKSFGEWHFLGLTNPQWGLIILVGFFLLTHGLYRKEKGAEG